MENTDSATDMSVPAIIRELTPYTGRFPENAVRAAIAKRGEVAPHLVQALEDVVKDPARYAGDQDLMLHVFAVFLLGQFRDKRAYRPLIEIVSVPGDMAFDLLGDTITENLKNLLGSVYDGDPAPLKQLIENSEAEEFVRNAAVRTFPVLVHTGQMSREEAADYYRSLFRGRLERNPNHAWNGLACSVADLPAPELLQELRQAYEDELVEPGFAGFDELERAARQSPEQFTARVAGRFDLVDDAVTEMKSWAAFQPDGWTPPRAQPQSHSSRPHLPADYQTGALVRPKPDVGRNDPCPCGSGRKYKKCCLGKS